MPPTDSLRDFGRDDVRDSLHNRAARAAFFHSLPGRMMVELEELPDPLNDETLPTAGRSEVSCGRFAMATAIGLLAIGFLVGWQW